MPTDAWTDTEIKLIVEDYFAMLSADLAHRPYNKTAHRKALQKRIGRTESAIEYKHRNISAVLKGLGQAWIPGYKPLFHFQRPLVDAVAQCLDRDSPSMNTAQAGLEAGGIGEPAVITIGSPPILRDNSPPNELRKLRVIARDFNVAERETRNRALGRKGEQLVFQHERSALIAIGRPDLAKRVRWVSQDEGDGAGYDIFSFSLRGQPRLIEVKTTNGWELTPFYITRHELAVAEENRPKWRLLRVWNFARQPRGFKLRPPLDSHVTLCPTSFEARFVPSKYAL